MSAFSPENKELDLTCRLSKVESNILVAFCNTVKVIEGFISASFRVRVRVDRVMVDRFAELMQIYIVFVV